MSNFSTSLGSSICSPLKFGNYLPDKPCPSFVILQIINVLLPNNQMPLEKNCTISILGESRGYFYIGVPSNLTRASRKHLCSAQIRSTTSTGRVLGDIFECCSMKLNTARALHIHFLEFHFVHYSPDKFPCQVIIRLR